MKRVVIDIEANGLEDKATKIWLIVCKDIDTGQFYIFRRPSDDPQQLAAFKAFAEDVDLWIGHNWLGYDYPVLVRLIGFLPDSDHVVNHSVDTLVISKMADYPRSGHSIEDYGLEFNLPKGDYTDWSKYTKDLEDYCIRDVEITHKVYNKYLRYIYDVDRRKSILCEYKFQLICNDLHTNGFFFNSSKAKELLSIVEKQLSILDKDILEAFKPKEKLIRTFTPKATKYNTISLSSVPKALRDNIHNYEIGKTYNYTKLEPFNPSSPKQIIEVLNEAGWAPVNKTTTHILTERELLRLSRERNRSVELDTKINECQDKLLILSKFGWKIDETNLSTLPDTAPPPAKSLAKRILLESRRRTLVEWLSLASPETNRLHGKFYSIGAWTHRMAHQNPNTANIPTGAKLFGDEMRSLWCVPKNRLLVGVDAEAIQLRIFAHYIDDPEFTEALVRGKKEDKSDAHSLNQRILGAKSRNDAKRFIFAYLLGAGVGKLAQILGVDREQGQSALDRLTERYVGLDFLKSKVIPSDAKRGWFVGLDGRAVVIPGDTEDKRRHLAMSGYLQNGEAVVMKHACILWHKWLKEEGIDFKFVNFVHDEWQTECDNNLAIAHRIAKLQADALRVVGEELGVKCPLAGSYFNDDIHDFTIGLDWHATH